MSGRDIGETPGGCVTSRSGNAAEQGLGAERWKVNYINEFNFIIV